MYGKGAIEVPDEDVANICSVCSTVSGIALSSCTLAFFAQLCYQWTKYRRRGLEDKHLASLLKKHVFLLLGCIAQAATMFVIGLNSGIVGNSAPEYPVICLTFAAEILVGYFFFSYSRYLCAIQGIGPDEVGTNERLKRKICVASMPLKLWIACILFFFFWGFIDSLLNNIFNEPLEGICYPDDSSTTCTKGILIKLFFTTVAITGSVWSVVKLLKHCPSLAVALSFLVNMFQLGVSMWMSSDQEESEDSKYLWVIVLFGNACIRVLLITGCFGVNFKRSIFVLASEAHSFELDDFALRDDEEDYITGKNLVRSS